MREVQLRRMQEVSLQRWLGIALFNAYAIATQPSRRAIERVAHDRVSQRGQMYADLVRAPCFDMHLHQRERAPRSGDVPASEPFQHAPVTYRGACAVLQATLCGHADAPHGVASYGQIDRSLVLPHVAMDERHVHLA